MAFLGKLTPYERQLLMAMAAVYVASFTVALCVPPALYHRRLRTPLLAAVRATGLLTPLAVSSILGSAPSPAASLFTRTLRSLLLLLVPLAFVDGGMIAGAPGGLARAAREAAVLACRGQQWIASSVHACTLCTPAAARAALA